MACAILALSLACGGAQEASTPRPQLTIESEAAKNVLAIQVTPEPVATVVQTPTQKPTLTLAPTPTLRPTVTPRPTASPHPTAIPRPTATSQAAITQRGATIQEANGTITERFIVDAGNYSTYEIQSAADGYINFEFQSLNLNNPTEPLDIGFEISSNEWHVFQADELIFFAASIQAERGEEYQFLFDNASSLFAGKTVTLVLSRSNRPSYPLLPKFGEYEGSESCKQINSTLEQSISAIDIDNVITLAIAAYSGDWLGIIVEGLVMSAAIYQANVGGDAALNKAAYAIAAWGCGYS